jgi:hypothetical protein
MHEGMQFAAAYHTEMAMRLAMFWAVVSLTAMSMLERSPTEAFQEDVVGETFAKFREHAE